MKKAFSILTGLALSMVLLTSCEKNPETGSGVISDAGAITGVVKDAETGKGLANSYIHLDPYGPFTKTDAEGRFLFGHVPPGLGYSITRADRGDDVYDIVFLSVDGEVRDLNWHDDFPEDLQFRDMLYFFSLKAGQVRNLEIHVEKYID